MAETINVAADVIGTLMSSTGGPKARAAVRVWYGDDDTPNRAELRLLVARYGGGPVEKSVYELIHVRPPVGLSNRWIFTATDGLAVDIMPATCACGMGVVGHADPFWDSPWASRQRVRMPGWLTGLDDEETT